MKSTVVILAILAILISIPALAEDVWIPIAGSVGVFRTDVRVFNPGASEVSISAYYLPVGGQSNGTVAPVTITVPARSMRVFDDAVQSMFGGGAALGAIRLSAASDIEATGRIYAQGESGTLGQFMRGAETAEITTRGALLQLKSFGTAPDGFRTNVGAANPNASPVTIRFRLFDRNNALSGAVRELTLPGFGVLGPTEIRGLFGTTEAANADLTDAWVSFDADAPVVVYGSVVDNATTDPTFVAAVQDSGSDPAPQPTVKTFNITARQFQYDVQGGGPVRVKVGDRVRFLITSTDVTHGFQMSPYVSSMLLNPGVTADTGVFEVTAAGNVTFFCTNFCGSGHDTMSSTMVVDP